MNKPHSITVLVICLLFFELSSIAQVKYWVKLKDKNGTPYSTSNPSAFLSPQSIARRTAYNIAIDNSDLPVTPSYLSQIENVPNVTVVYASKWLNGVVVSVPSKSLAPAAMGIVYNLSFVADTFRVKRMKLSLPLPSQFDGTNQQSNLRTSTNTSSTYNYGGSYWQNAQLNVICLHEAGFRGQGMTIAVLDAGFINVDNFSVFDSLRNNGGILGTRDFVNGTANAYYGSRHGTMVLSCIAGNKPGRILGSAPLAKFWLLRTEDESAETITEEYNWIRGAEFADSVGVDMLTTSLGYTNFDITTQNHTYATLNGKTAPMSIAATMAARKGMFVLNAAGNEGQSNWRYISVPGDADSICTVGAIDSLENVVAFSSVGPTADGRIKPDLVARGAGAWVSDGTYDGFPGNGTSFATPILAGAVACYWQAHKNFNNHKVLDTLKKSASTTCFPNNSGGWGLPKTCFTTLSNTLSGVVTLQNETDHSGILVNYIHDAPSTKQDTTRTKNDGTYTLATDGTAGKLSFSKSGFTNKSFESSSLNLKRCTWLSNIELEAIEVPGEVKGFDFTVYADADKNELSVMITKNAYEFIKIEIFDFVGHVMMSDNIPITKWNSVYDISFYSDAIYFVKVSTSLGTLTKKFRNPYE